MPFFGKTKSDTITEVKEFLNKIIDDDNNIAKWTEYGKKVEGTQISDTVEWGKEEYQDYTTASFYLKNTFYETLKKFSNLPDEYNEAFKTIIKECSSNCKKYNSACEKIMERMNTDWIYLDNSEKKDVELDYYNKPKPSINGINISNGNYEYLSEDDFNNLVIFYVDLFNDIKKNNIKKNNVETYVTEYNVETYVTDYEKAKVTKAAEAAAKKAAKEAAAAEKEAAAAEKEAAEAAEAAENNKVKAAAEKEKHKKYCEDCAKKCHSEGNDKHSSGGSRYKTKKRRTYKIGKRRTYKIGKRKTPKKKRSYKTGKRGAKRRTRRKI